MAALIRCARAAFALTALGCGVEQPSSERYTDVPFVLSQQFTPSGFMGAGATPGALTIRHDACPTRPKGALGQCYTFVYDPTVDPTVGWAGVQWQSPPNNWGDMPPKYVQAGARRLRFKLRGSRAAKSKVSVEVGGERPVLPKPFYDSFRRAAACELTVDWTSCEVDLSGTNYEHILNAFTWSLGGETEPIVIYLDDLIWE